MTLLLILLDLLLWHSFSNTSPLITQYVSSYHSSPWNELRGLIRLCPIDQRIDKGRPGICGGGGGGGPALSRLSCYQSKSKAECSRGGHQAHPVYHRTCYIEILDVVVVGHSYGGTPSLYACERLWRAVQPVGAAGVLRVALLTSNLTLPGVSIARDRMEYGKKHGGIDDSGGKTEMVGEVRSFTLLTERTPDVR